MALAGNQYSYNNAAAQYSTFIWVQGGLQGAMAYPMAPNSTAMFMDRDEMVLYVRSKDLSGRDLPVAVYDLVKREEPVQNSSDDLSALITSIVNKCLDERDKRYKERREQYKKHKEDVNA